MGWGWIWMFCNTLLMHCNNLSVRPVLWRHQNKMLAWRNLKLEGVSQMTLISIQKWHISAFILLMLSWCPSWTNTSTEVPELTKMKEMWAVGVQGKDYFQWNAPWRQSSLVIPRLAFFLSLLTCSPAGPGTPCSPGTPGNPCKNRIWGGRAEENCSVLLLIKRRCFSFPPSREESVFFYGGCDWTGVCLSSGLPPEQE